jgi:hypothetical protein
MQRVGKSLPAIISSAPTFPLFRLHHVTHPVLDIADTQRSLAPLAIIAWIHTIFVRGAVKDNRAAVE